MDNQSTQDSLELINNLSFCVIDLETTGGNHQKDKIIEIGMVKVINKEVGDSKSILIDPEIPIPEFIQKLTNISQDDVKGAKKIEEVIDEIIDFIGDDIIVAHNTSFDVPFLNSVLKRLKRDELKNKVICTNVMTKHLIPEILNSNLNYMSRLFNIEHSNAHRAYDDALATAKLLIIYLDIFISKGIKKVNQLYYPRNKFELDRTHIDSENSVEDVVKLVKSQESSLLITVKGERGLILAVLPVEKPKEEADFLGEILKDIDWKIVTLKLTKPILEGIFQFNNHFLKYPETTREKVLNYLLDRYHYEGDKNVNIHSLDFVLTHHLVSDQIISYSFLHLNTNIKPIFKIPAQKKKLYQHLTSQIGRFESDQKGRKKHILHKEIVPLVESFLALNKGQNKYLFLDRKDVKNSKDGTIKQIEDFVREDLNSFNFPTNHL